MLAFYLTSLGVIPVFAFRAFLPLFVTALVARVGPEWAPLADLAGIQPLAGLPAWITDDTTLVILGGMAALEIVLGKVPEARELLDFTGVQLKAIAAFLTCFYLVEGDPGELLDHIRKEGLTTDYAWGQSFAYTWSFAVGSVVWFGAALRKAIYGFLRELDEDDSAGLQKLLSWLEDGIGFFGVIAAFVLPIFAVVTAAVTLLGLLAVRRWLQAREESQKAACPTCGVANHLCAVQCASCRTPLSAPRRVGWFGVARVEAVSDLDEHRLRLLANKRCPSCAARLVEKRLDQRCTACETAPFPDAASFDRYLDELRGRLPKTLGVSFGFGLIPLVGLVPGIIYYRLSLIASLRHYIPRATGMFTRWLVRLLNLVLVLLQPVPVVGGFTLPLMCWTNYAFYERALRRQR